MADSPQDINPYASPAIENPGNLRLSASYEMVKDLKRFRSEIHALGALWIVIGILAVLLAGAGVGVSAAMFSSDQIVNEDLLIFLIVGGFGLVWLALGICACLKHIWAVYVGLVLSYLVAILNLASCNICVLVIFASSIAAGHRVISWVGSFRRRGIPLTARPQDLQTTIKLPPLQ